MAGPRMVCGRDSRGRLNERIETMSDQNVAAIEAAKKWAEVYAEKWDTASFHESLSYPEAEALADLLHLAGRGDLAADLIGTWANCDPDEAFELHDRIEASYARYGRRPSAY